MLIYLDEYRKAKAARAAGKISAAPAARMNRAATAAAAVTFCFRHTAAAVTETAYDFPSIDRDGVLDRIHALASQF